MNNLKVAIIEDEVPAARLLHSMLRRLRPAWEVMVLPGSVEEAVQWFAENPHPDLLFLDIQLSDGDSFSFLTSARPSSVIIFTTAYDQYAIRAFTVNSVDYILKPVDEKRLLEAIVKYETLLLQIHLRKTVTWMLSSIVSGIGRKPIVLAFSLREGNVSVRWK